jgi:hypothetical protein
MHTIRSSSAAWSAPRLSRCCAGSACRRWTIGIPKFADGNRPPRRQPTTIAGEEHASSPAPHFRGRATDAESAWELGTDVTRRDASRASSAVHLPLAKLRPVRRPTPARRYICSGVGHGVVYSNLTIWWLEAGLERLEAEAEPALAVSSIPVSSQSGLSCMLSGVARLQPGHGSSHGPPSG